MNFLFSFVVTLYIFRVCVCVVYVCFSVFLFIVLFLLFIVLWFAADSVFAYCVCVCYVSGVVLPFEYICLSLRFFLRTYVGVGVLGRARVAWAGSIFERRLGVYI